MPRKPQPWFRWYTEAAHDRKMRRLTPTQRWLFVAMCSAAKESPELGRLLVSESEPMTDKEVAEYADVSVREVTKALPVLDRLDMVKRDESGALMVLNMRHRQYESDSSTPRVQAHRERSKDDVETLQPSSKERSSNVSSNAPDTETETETEEDSSSELRSDVESLCEHLAKRIEENGSRRPGINKAWRDSARLMLDKDGRTEGQVHRMIDWCQADGFWRANILSMPKLREKYDGMRLKASETSGSQVGLKRDVFGFLV